MLGAAKVTRTVAGVTPMVATTAEGAKGGVAGSETTRLCGRLRSRVVLGVSHLVRGDDAGPHGEVGHLPADVDRAHRGGGGAIGDWQA